jgi:PAS domain S-box-containing protein
MQLNPITMLPHFPASMLGASLLDVIRSAVDGVVVVDANRRIVLVNHKAERIFGYPASFLLEKSLDILLPVRSCGDTRRPFERAASSRPCGRRSKFKLRGVRVDGTALVLNVSVSRLTIHGGIYLALVVHEAVPLHVFTQPATGASGVSTKRWTMFTHQASEIEKRRFSRKLYDDIGQSLSVLKLDLDWLGAKLPVSNTYLPARLAEMQGLLDSVITLTKSMASTLRPPVLDDFGLVPAVEWLTNSFRKRTAIDCTLKCSGLDEKIDDSIESAVFRIVQEALANIEQHSRAQQVAISLARSGNLLDVLIQDNGIGMESDSPRRPDCFGLIAMQERVFVLGGTIHLENVRPHGVLIHASIPLEADDGREPNHTPVTVHDTNRNCRRPHNNARRPQTNS